MDTEYINHFKKEKKTIFIIFISVLTIFLFTLIISTAVDIQNKLIEVRNTLVVSGTGEIYAKPDLALMTFSVVTEAKTVDATMAENTEKMNNIISSIKSQGVEDKDLKTTSFSIYPRYEYEKGEIYPSNILLDPPGKRILVGYEVSQSLQVKIRDLGRIGDIIQGATDNGANQVGSLQFTIDNQDELKKEAREQAIKKAKAKAKELTSQLGVKLGRITNFSEGSSAPRYYGLMAEAMGGGGEDLQIETGENKITVTVSLTYEIN
tara:strand:- start:468 stop:1259 length:792 start_codon:yes stop_codon:yes gene_type:complete